MVEFFYKVKSALEPILVDLLLFLVQYYFKLVLYDSS